jgi:hypothetical protein
MPRGRLTPEQLQRLRQRRRDPEVIARHAAKVRGRKLTSEHKAKMAAGQRGKPKPGMAATRRRLMREDPEFYRRWYEATFAPEAKAKQGAAISRAQRGRERVLSADQKLLKLLRSKQWSEMLLGISHGAHLLRSQIKTRELMDAVVAGKDPDWQWELPPDLAELAGQDYISLATVRRWVAELNAELRGFASMVEIPWREHLDRARAIYAEYQAKYR